MEGWIRLHRKVQQHWLYKEKRVFSRYEAWLDILFLASWKDDKAFLNGELVDVQRGSFPTSELQLMERWKWGKSKLKNFLSMLENEGMITKKSSKKGTMIIVENYGLYQCVQTTDEPQTDRRRTIGEPQADYKETINELQTDLYKEDNKDNNIKNISSELSEPDAGVEKKIKQTKKYEPDSTYYKAAVWLANSIQERFPEIKYPDEAILQKWSDQARLMIEKDKRDTKLTNELLRFSQNDSFWHTNILSMGKFREKYDQLLAKYTTLKNSQKTDTADKSYAGYRDLGEQL